MTRTDRAVRLAAPLLAMGAVLASCGPSGSPTPDATAEARETQIEHERVEVGPMPLEAAPQQADMRATAPRAEAPAAAAPPARQPSPNRVSGANAVAPSGSGVWREDGRPAWWVDRAGWRDGRYTLSAEAMGDDVLSARRAALAAARAEAQRTLGEGMRDGASNRRS